MLLGVEVLQGRGRLTHLAATAMTAFIQRALTEVHSKAQPRDDCECGRHGTGAWIGAEGGQLGPTLPSTCCWPGHHAHVSSPRSSAMTPLTSCPTSPAALAACLQLVGCLPLVAVAQLAAFVSQLVGRCFLDLADLDPQAFGVGDVLQGWVTVG